MQNKRRKKNFVGALDIELIEDSVRACANNALQLTNEAGKLLEQEAYSRSMFLALTAIEEMGKVIMLLSSIWHSQADAAFWRRFWKRFRTHGEKFGRMQMLIAVGPELFSEFQGFARLLGKHARVVQLLRGNRELALYVDFNEEGDLVEPSRFTPQQAQEVVEAAQDLAGHFRIWSLFPKGTLSQLKDMGKPTDTEGPSTSR